MGKKSNGKGRGKRESVSLEARRAECFRRWRARESLQQIADAVGLKSRQLVCLDIQLAIQHWRTENRGSIKEAAEHEWQLLNGIQLELEQLYEQSKTKDGAEWRILVDGVLKISEHRRKLLGLDKPTKIEAQTTSELTVTHTFKKLDDLKSDIRKRREQMKARKSESAK